MRHSVGAIGLLMLLAGALLYWQGADNQLWSSLAIRVGSLLAVIWLAWDSVAALRGRVPAPLIALAGVGLLAVAMQPNRGRLFIGLLVAVVGISTTLRWLARISGNDARPSPARQRKE